MTRMKFNHEQPPGKEKPYTVTVTATDTRPGARPTTIKVDIYVVDVDEIPVGNRRHQWKSIPSVIARRTSKMLRDAICDATWPESVRTLTASDPEGATPITWSLVSPRGVDSHRRKRRRRYRR